MKVERMYWYGNGDIKRKLMGQHVHLKRGSLIRVVFRSKDVEVYIQAFRKVFGNNVIKVVPFPQRKMSNFEKRVRCNVHRERGL